MGYETIIADVVVINDNAIFLRQGKSEFWVPKSLIEDWDEDADNWYLRTFEIKTWFCEKEGIS